MPLSVAPLSRTLLRDDILSRLRDAIVDGSLAPGEQLRDGDLAERLGVSRTPVREALLELARAGLVRSTPGRSTVVAPLEDRAILDAQSVVAAMHGVAAREAVARLTPADLDEMRAANADFTAAQRRGDLDAAVIADARFHAVAVSACGNAAVAGVLSQYEPVLRRAERLRFGSHEGAESAERHARLIAACADGDAEAAAHLAEQTWRSLSLAPRTDTHPTPTEEHRP
ncbi:GntR family transcriptional regulator [Microbacterium dextranolyticum]|uniref:GntR family transcriptional regulator n=1 Tax=Microbacterium dextranolyticum TaxID=36806 RepID=UPI001959F290|nr:GntR family transcriptional regulator [Microbacterium dextranolyticum]MBM7463615.1 DNA-binding GntR family transcriptional regulator [Microbacterium dextranolyticum]